MRPRLGVPTGSAPGGVSSQRGGVVRSPGGTEGPGQPCGCPRRYGEHGPGVAAVALARAPAPDRRAARDARATGESRGWGLGALGHWGAAGHWERLSLPSSARVTPSLALASGNLLNLGSCHLSLLPSSWRAVPAWTGAAGEGGGRSARGSW